MKPLSFKSLKQMLDTLRTDSRKAESSKVCISAVTARNVLRYDKE